MNLRKSGGTDCRDHSQQRRRQWICQPVTAEKNLQSCIPKYDLFSARNLVESIASRFCNDNRRTDMKLKAVTVSAGISAAPYAARNVKGTDGECGSGLSIM